VAILLGDSVPFWLGRKYGMNALRLRWVRRVLHPERFAKMEQRFREHGNWATFACRFIAGVRVPGYFIAGTMRMSYPRFILLDALGVAISVPASILLGKLFGNSFDTLKQKVGDLHLILAFLVVSLLFFMVWRGRARKESEPR
jgi:membrane protein DedA with SNARE-associated domain